MAENVYMQLPLPDDVVRFVFAKLDFADVALYAYLVTPESNFI
jgi:hypothetical protein